MLSAACGVISRSEPRPCARLRAARRAELRRAPPPGPRTCRNGPDMSRDVANRERLTDTRDFTARESASPLCADASENRYRIACTRHLW